MAKWYVSIVIAVVTFLGFSTHEYVAPNQEIVLQFANQTSASKKVEKAIAEIKAQLLDLGAANIQVRQQKDGKLSIAYYSNKAVSNVKKLFSQDASLEFAYTSIEKDKSQFPYSKSAKDYELSIYELQNGFDLDSGLNGKSTVQVKRDFDKSSNQNIKLYSNKVEATQVSIFCKIAFKLQVEKSFVINNTEQTTPDTRAGPLS